MLVTFSWLLDIVDFTFYDAGYFWIPKYSECCSGVQLSYVETAGLFQVLRVGIAQ